jgi:bifunctional non-homologous end joining protein LigD
MVANGQGFARFLRMSLREYKGKRHFDATPEPKGKKKRGPGPLRFVAQKHEARRLHYDFRLELDGVLKSWAVPKGPSLDPSDKRLAVMVEDHPLDYRTFEGVIPEGNYGAGTVIVWDEGTYEAPGTTGRAESEEAIRAGLAKGHIRFVLHGHKLKGEFSLVKLKRSDKQNEWLLFKHKDAFASGANVLDDARSVRSGKTLTTMATGSPAEWKSNRPATSPALRLPSKKPKAAVKQVRAPADAPRGEFPHDIEPMLACPVDAPFDKRAWIFEVKWDGYRAIAEVQKKKIRLYSRNLLPFEARYPAIVESLRNLGHEAVLDGEVVVVDERGRSRFQLLQTYQKTGKCRLVYYVFDLLYLDGRDLRSLPLRKRKEVLAKLIVGMPNIRLSEHIEEQGTAFFQAAMARGLEGIIAKDAQSPYRSGRRCKEWLKVKVHRQQEAVIGGFTEPRGSRVGLGALLLGVYDGDDLVYIGHTGGGLDDQGLADLRARLEPLAQQECPFRERPKANAPVHWVKSTLVCEVTFQEWTEDGRMRHPIFIGLREDKPAREVHREIEQPVEQAVRDDRDKPRTKRASEKREEPNDLPAEHSDGPTPTLTHLNKVYWPDEGYTKKDLIDYYRDIAPIILPYLRDRPESLHRHPNGITAASFFQKDVSKQPPPAWVETVTLFSENEGKDVRYILCQNEATLLYLANLGCIELNPLNSRVATLDRPDYVVLDLDPVDVPREQLVEAALAVRKVLDRLGADSVCKTSGKRGLHVYVPLGARYDYDQARQFAELIAKLVNQQLPATTSVLRSPALRPNRVYLDFLQNRRGQTLAAPYAVRPVRGATVSTPLKWSEVNKKLDPTKFTIKTMRRRLDRVDDLWKPVLGEGIDLEKALRTLSEGAAVR